MSEGYLIGIDLGTTLAKCTIYDIECKAVSEATKEMNVAYPSPGVAEQDAMQFYEVSCYLIRKCLENKQVDKNKIVALSIDSQMGGIMSIDKNFNPVTYYDTPLDNRSANENRYMNGSFGDLLVEKSGCFSAYGHKILYWKNRNEWNDIFKFIHPAAFVAGKLAGLSGKDAFMDETFICFSGFADLKNSKWSEEIINKLELDINKLPNILKSTKIIGEITTKASEDCNLPKGTPISAGCGDQAAGFVGAGVFNKGDMVDVSGTACILGITTDEYVYDYKNRTLACMKSALGEKYYLMSVILGGMTHKWFIDEFFSYEKNEAKEINQNIYDYLDNKASKIEPGSNGLVSINYLQGRFFPPDPFTRGLFIGHTLSHTKLHFYRSILESIAYDHYLTKTIIKDLIPEMKFNKVTAIGSGAKSNFWLKLKSDVLQLPYRNLERSDLSTLGSAIIAGFSVGIFKNFSDFNSNIIKIKRNFNPKKDEDKKYYKFIEVYRSLFSALKNSYEQIGLN